MTMLLTALSSCQIVLVVNTMAAALSTQPQLPLVSRLQGFTAMRLGDRAEKVDLGAMLAETSCLTVTVFGTYAADFNAIEYAQRLRFYAPKLREQGVDKCIFVLNASPEACRELVELVDIPSSVEVLCDPSGRLGRAFGASRGWMPDNDSLSFFGASIPLNPYGKLFGMLWGLGALGTLPAVIGGYLGNPIRPQPWIEDAMQHNTNQDRWPKATSPEFAELPVFGSWARRPLELATLRLQNMLGISIKYWDKLKPDDDDMQVLTQLGGLALTEPGGKVLFEWRDPGICAVCNFEDILAVLTNNAASTNDVPASALPQQAQPAL